MKLFTSSNPIVKWVFFKFIFHNFHTFLYKFKVPTFTAKMIFLD